MEDRGTYEFTADDLWQELDRLCSEREQYQKGDVFAVDIMEKYGVTRDVALHMMKKIVAKGEYKIVENVPNPVSHKLSRVLRRVE